MSNLAELRQRRFNIAQGSTARRQENSLSPAELRIANRNRERSPMISRRTIVLAFTAGTFLASVLPVLAKSRHSNWIRTFDTDNDGTVDLAEAKAAASKLFDKLDRDHDGTLDRRELRGRMVSKEFGAADGDHDGTLDKDEYLAAVEKSFKAADRDNDGTLDAKELGSARGRALLRLLR